MPDISMFFIPYAFYSIPYNISLSEGFVAKSKKFPGGMTCVHLANVSMIFTSMHTRVCQI